MSDFRSFCIQTLEFFNLFQITTSYMNRASYLPLSSILNRKGSAGDWQMNSSIKHQASVSAASSAPQICFLSEEALTSLSRSVHSFVEQILCSINSLSLSIFFLFSCLLFRTLSLHQYFIEDFFHTKLTKMGRISSKSSPFFVNNLHFTWLVIDQCRKCKQGK